MLTHNKGRQHIASRCSSSALSNQGGPTEWAGPAAAERWRPRRRRWRTWEERKVCGGEGMVEGRMIPLPASSWQREPGGQQVQAEARRRHARHSRRDASLFVFGGTPLSCFAAQEQRALERHVSAAGLQRGGDTGACRQDACEQCRRCRASHASSCQPQTRWAGTDGTRRRMRWCQTPP